MTKKAKPEVKNVVIVGGGFGGIRCALELYKKHIPNLKVHLISAKPHFDYHAGLYRLVTGRSAKEVCIPLKDIFKNTSVKLVNGFVSKCDLQKQVLYYENSKTLEYDYLVLALGSDVSYFNIPGVKEHSFSLKNIEDGLRLNKHLHKTIMPCIDATKESNECASHIIVIGGGASGVELAGELAIYAKKLAARHSMDPKSIRIDLIERAPRVLFSLPRDISKKVEFRLKRLGVKVFVNKEVMSEEFEDVFLKDMALHSRTVIWTAGACGNPLLKNIDNIELNKSGKVIVDESLRPRGFENVFVIGDAAETKYSGMAQTAMYDGFFVACEIFNQIYSTGQHLPYNPHKPIYSIPVGPNWAVYYDGKSTYYGKLGWWLRRYLDLKVMLMLMPFYRAIKAFRYGGVVSENCPICSDLSS